MRKACEVLHQREGSSDALRVAGASAGPEDRSLRTCLGDRRSQANYAGDWLELTLSWIDAEVVELTTEYLSSR